MSGAPWVGEPWIGVDLDGTLARWQDGQNPDYIGPPVVPMLRRVKRWIEEGKKVRIVTARVAEEPGYRNTLAERHKIGNWLEMVGLPPLDITCRKDPSMIELWDDRAVQVVQNTGIRVDGKA